MEVTPPPVVEGNIKSEPRNYWTWFVFAGLAAFMILTNLMGMVAMGGDQKDILSSEKLSAPVAIKQFVTLTELSRVNGFESFETTAQASLSSSEEAFRSKMDQSDEAAAWVLTLQVIQNEKLDPNALDRLQLSENEEFAQLGNAFEGMPNLEAKIKGDDFPEIVARWRSENGAGKTFPLTELGVGSSPALYLGFLTWMVFVVGGGFITLIAYVILKLNGQLSPQGYQSQISLKGFDARGGRMAVYFAVFLGLQIVAGLPLLFKLDFDPVVSTAIVMLIMILLVPFLSTMPFFGEKLRISEIIGDKSKLFQKFLWGFGGYMVNFPLALVATVLVSPLQKFFPTPSHELLEMISGSSPFNALLLFFVAAIAAPLVEEPMFRGVLFPALQRVLKTPTAAIIISGIIFAVIHPQGPLLWPALACIGTTAAVLTRQTGSLMPAILMHFLHNATIYGLNVIIR